MNIKIQNEKYVNLLNLSISIEEKEKYTCQIFW